MFLNAIICQMPQGKAKIKTNIDNGIKWSGKSISALSRMVFLSLATFKRVLILTVNDGLKKTKGLAIPYSKPIFH